MCQKRELYEKNGLAAENHTGAFQFKSNIFFGRMYFCTIKHKFEMDKMNVVGFCK